MSFRASAAGALLVVLGACGSGDSTGPNNNGNSSGQFFMRATVDGAWRATVPTNVSLVVPGTYTITGVQIGGANPYIISIQLYHIRGPGTYPLGVGPQVPGGSGLVSGATGGWGTPLNGNAGSITITTLTSSVIAGSFNFTGEGVTTTGTKTVTSGEFNLQVTPVGTVGPVPDNAGSTVSATINNGAWNAAAVAGSVSGTPTNLVISASNLSGGLSLTIANVTGAGTYPLSAATSRSIGYSTPTGQVWTSSSSGGGGTVVVTSFTATRIRGTFTATLNPAAGTTATGTVAITSGTFDIGRLF